MDSNLIAELQLKEIPDNMKHYKRYQIISLSRSGVRNKVISKITDCSKGIISRWRQRSDINDNPRSGRPLIYDEPIQLKTIAFYCQTTPLPDCGRWSLRTAGKHLKNNSNLIGLPTSPSTIQRILKNHKLKPHLSNYFLQITDPDFFPKMEPLIQLYLNPPENLFCFDECPGIQVLQRLAPDLQTEETRIRLEEFEYIRNGTIDVFAFLQVKTGNVFSECRADHTIKTLVEIFEKHLETLPENETIHYILDNLASHVSYELCSLVARYSKVKCPSPSELDKVVKRRQWLQSEDKRIVFHYTPFHGSWLNMVEIWFSILSQKCLQESFASPESMYNAIYAFDYEWNTLLAHPFKWTYDGKGLHQKAVKRFISMLENSLEKMNVKFITKQFLLMANLIKSYQKEVDPVIWKKLDEVINLNFKRLNSMITKKDGQKRKDKALKALKNLIDSLYIILDKSKKAAA